MRGWLYKQDSSGLRLWKRRWFVLVDLCLYYYRDSSEQQVRGGLPLPGYEIRILPAAPRAPRFLFTAEHPGMRTYCLGAETPEELNAWVCALRRGASPLPRSPCAPSLQMPQEPQSGGPPLSPRPCGWCPPWPPAEEVVGPPMPPTRHPLVPPLHPSKVSPRPEEAPARGEPRPMLTPPPLGRSLRELRPPWSSDHPAAAPSGRRGARCRGASHGGQSGTGFSTWLF
ncbi:pleckstrin homology domain-containing family A member 4-like isoform X3 [Falco peregrinus]|nr:pleckstrin homology domain-containing family A member 4-like isoform X3 [Falco peregrinus]